MGFGERETKQALKQVREELPQQRVRRAQNLRGCKDRPPDQLTLSASAHAKSKPERARSAISSASAMLAVKAGDTAFKT